MTLQAIAARLEKVEQCIERDRTYERDDIQREIESLRLDIERHLLTTAQPIA